MTIKPTPTSSYYFVAIQFNSAALIRYRDMMEGFIAELPGKSPSWVDPSSGKGQVILFHDGLVRSLLPITLRSSFLVSSWALYESSVLEIAAFLAEERALPRLSINPRIGFLAETSTYFAETLGFARDENPRVSEELQTLYKLRNAIAHGGGRKGAVREPDWRQLTQAAEARGDFGTSRGVIEPSEELVYSVCYLVQDAVNHLVSNARQLLADPQSRPNA